MVTKSEDVSCKNCSDQSQQTENPNSKSGKLETTKKESSLRSSPNTDVAESPHIEYPKTETPVSHPNQEEGSGEHTPGSNNEEGCILSNTPANVLHNLNQEKFILSITPEKALHKLPPRRNLEIVSHVLQSTQEQKPAVIPDKPSEDGYNWRKYGQKFVRGNEFIRSYYKCTFLNCTAKKQVERSHDGRITDIKYLRKHEHPKPQRSPTGSANFVSPVQVRKADSTSLARSEDKSAIVHVESTEDPRTSIIVAHKDVEVDGLESNRTRDVVDDGDDPNPKRQKTDVPTVNDIPVNKINGEPRIVVQTMSEVDIVSDGYRWRKYGQKLVKGNPNPRSYYRCSSTGCPVKKHVERASHDPKVVLTTYEGQHDHDMPYGRTLTFNSTENSNNNKSSVTPTVEDVKPEPTDENKNENKNDSEAVALVPVSAN